MRSYNRWLWEQLRRELGDAVAERYSPLVEVTTRQGIKRIWCPTPQDYIITADCVREVAEIGGNMISWAQMWARGPSAEATELAQELGINIMMHGGTINWLRGRV